MDPIGFALENYDAVGRWRANDAGEPIDASGRLPDGTAFDGPAGLNALLLSRYKDDFVRTSVEKLLTYALGRGLEYYDNPAVRTIIRQSAACNLPPGTPRSIVASTSPESGSTRTTLVNHGP